MGHLEQVALKISWTVCFFLWNRLDLQAVILRAHIWWFFIWTQIFGGLLSLPEDPRTD